MVDVTHDGDDRRAEGEIGLVALVLTELEVERLEQLAVLVLGRDDLDDVVELLTEELERRVVDRLGRRHHLAEAEQHLHELGRVDADPVGEVGQRGAAGQPDGLAVALADAHAADRRGLHGLELLTTGPLRLAATARGAAGATEGALGLATLAGTTATWPTAAGETSAGTTGGTCTGTAGATWATATGRTTAAGSTGTTGTTGTAGATATGTTGATATGAATEGGRGLGHHRRVGTRHARAALGRRAGRTLSLGDGVATCGLGAGTRRGTAAHALARRERVVARTRARPGRPTGRGAGALGVSVPDSAAGASGSAGGSGATGGHGRLGGGRSLRLGGGGLGRCLDGLGLRFDLLGGCLRGAGFLGGCLLGSRLLLGRGGRGGGRGDGLQLVAVLLLEPHLDGKLDRRGGRLDELAHLLQLLENKLALDVVLLGEFVNSGLGHVSPSGLETLVRGVASKPLAVCANSSGSTHRVLMSCCSSLLLGLRSVRVRFR